MAIQTRVGRLRDVFRAESNQIFDAQVAALSVLYEDLRIEMTGMTERSLPALDVLETEKEFADRPELIGIFRQLYFTRRSIATVREFAETLRLLSKNPFWVTLSATLLPDHSKYVSETLTAAIAFFDEKEPFIQRIRNGIGGHFGLKTALSALKHVPNDSRVKMEVVTHGGHSDIHLNFASEIAASALVEHLPGQNIKGFTNLMNDTIIHAYKHATRSVQAICGIWVWQRFGR